MAAFRFSEKVQVDNEQFTISVITGMIMLLCCCSRVAGMGSSSQDSGGALAIISFMSSVVTLQRLLTHCCVVKSFLIYNALTCSFGWLCVGCSLFYLFFP